MAQLENYSNYEIYEDGRIYSYKSKKWLSLTPRADGYIRVKMIDDNGKIQSLYLHRLVAMAYLPNPNNLPCVNHKDENRMNCHKDNLEWCSYQYNNTYGTKIERTLQNRVYETPTNAIRVAKLDRKTKEILEIFPSIKEAGRKYGSASHINEAAHGKRKSAYGFCWKIIEKE